MAVQQPVVLVNILVPRPARAPASVPAAMEPVHHHPVQTPVRLVRIQRAVHRHAAAAAAVIQTVPQGRPVQIHAIPMSHVVVPRTMAQHHRDVHL